VVVAAVELYRPIEGIADSKLVTKTDRERLNNLICQQAVTFSYGQASAAEIDRLGIAPALALAYERALETIKADLYLTDFIRLPNKKNLRAIKGDQLFYPVAAASIVAKVYRDSLMAELHQNQPEYDWVNNVGYGTKKHFDAITKHGPSSLHRQSFLTKFMGK